MDHPVKPQCRLCLSPSPEQYDSIVDSGVRCKLDIVFKFELPLDDWLPNVICDECSTKVDEFCFFHETVRTNQVQLRTTTTTDAGILMLEEIKAEPVDVEETEEIDIKESIITAADVAVDYGDRDEITEEPKGDEEMKETDSGQSSRPAAGAVANKDKDDQDSPSVTNPPIQKKHVRNEVDKKIRHHDRIIAKFFNGITCSICSEKFEMFQQLKTHSRNVHCQRAVFTCCERKFFQKYTLAQHIKLHMIGLTQPQAEKHNEKELEKQFTKNSKHVYCELCGKSFRSETSLDQHKLKFHSNAEEHPFKCIIRNKTLPKKDLVTIHERKSVEDKVGDNDSTFELQQKKDMQIMSDDRKIARFFNGITCSICSGKFESFRKLKTHCLNEHDGQQASIKCCERKFFERARLIDHIDIVHLDSKYTFCKLCNKEYSSKASLRLHNLLNHTNPEEHPFQCDVCGKKFPQKCFLTTHRSKHVRVKCSVCDLMMANVYTMKIHMANKHRRQLKGATTATTTDKQT